MMSTAGVRSFTRPLLCGIEQCFKLGKEKHSTPCILLFSAIRVSRHPDAASCRAARRTTPRTWSTLAPVVSRRGSGPRLALCPRVTRDNAREPFFARELPVTGHPAILYLICIRRPRAVSSCSRTKQIIIASRE